MLLTLLQRLPVEIQKHVAEKLSIVDVVHEEERLPASMLCLFKDRFEFACRANNLKPSLMEYTPWRWEFKRFLGSLTLDHLNDRTLTESELPLWWSIASYPITGNRLLIPEMNARPFYAVGYNRLTIFIKYLRPKVASRFPRCTRVIDRRIERNMRGQGRLYLTLGNEFDLEMQKEHGIDCFESSIQVHSYFGGLLEMVFDENDVLFYSSHDRQVGRLEVYRKDLTSPDPPMLIYSLAKECTLYQLSVFGNMMCIYAEHPRTHPRRAPDSRQRLYMVDLISGSVKKKKNMRNMSIEAQMITYNNKIIFLKQDKINYYTGFSIVYDMTTCKSRGYSGSTQRTPLNRNSFVYISALDESNVTVKLLSISEDVVRVFDVQEVKTTPVIGRYNDQIFIIIQSDIQHVWYQESCNSPPRLLKTFRGPSKLVFPAANGCQILSDLHHQPTGFVVLGYEMCRPKKKVERISPIRETPTPTPKKESGDENNDEKASKRNSKKSSKSAKSQGNNPMDPSNPTKDPKLPTQADDWSEENEAVIMSMGESLRSTRSSRKKRSGFQNKPEFRYALSFCNVGIEGLVQEFNTLRNYQAPDVTYNEFLRNKGSNRYADVPCLDPPKGDNILDSGYYHGNFVYFPQDENPRFPRYLICQGPLELTTVVFYDVVKRNGISCILMLCDWNENGKAKCFNYLPKDEETSKLFDISIPTVVEEENAPEGTTVRQCNWKGLDVTHIQWTGWPDHCGPVTSKPVFQLLELSKKYNKDKKKPVLVHCSAGIGRSGTLLALDLLKENFKNFDDNCKIPEILKYLRKYRAKAIQTAPQYVFLHIAFLDLLVEKYGPSVETAKMKTFRRRYAKYTNIVAQKQPVHPKPVGETGKAENSPAKQ
ncbi:unnamed protein product [Bursaphelenchus xylophilus]|uniref:(pine wood nematode) hypothetical protein n=1 Tax=Bursaphelenchus xylophilus TaxID=6326 RepID=A0A7I8WX83_BURXY|nr:unnamed protein product [Bursaphelenchus xylophilus]CAG9100188.1 unnamed protein product [Bursaphelenchus xylophilus]